MLGRTFDRLRGCFKLRRQRAFACPAPDELPEVDAAIPIALEPVTPENVDRVTDFRTRAEAAGFRAFLDRGQVGLFAVHDGRVIGHAWAVVCRGGRCLANGYFRLRAGEALIHFCRVGDSWRGKRVYPAMLAALAKRLLADEGVRRVLVDSEAANAASLRGIARAGFREIGRGTYVQVFGRLVMARFADTNPEAGRDSSSDG